MNPVTTAPNRQIQMTKDKNPNKTARTRMADLGRATWNVKTEGRGEHNH